MKIADEVLSVALVLPSPIGGGAGGGGINRNAAEWHAALMDFGSLVQTKSNPKWNTCPLTEKRIMKATKKSYELRATNKKNSKLIAHSSKLREPGRFMGAQYIPNRIFRGRIVDALREHDKGLTFEQIGSQICNDWSNEHHVWLEKIVQKLTQDMLIERKKNKFMLAD